MPRRKNKSYMVTLNKRYVPAALCACTLLNFSLDDYVHVAVGVLNAFILGYLDGKGDFEKCPKKNEAVNINPEVLIKALSRRFGSIPTPPSASDNSVKKTPCVNLK